MKRDVSRFKRELDALGKEVQLLEMIEKGERLKLAAHELEKRVRSLHEELGIGEHVLEPYKLQQLPYESETEWEKRIHSSSPWGSSILNQLRSQCFMDAMAVNEALIELSAKSITYGLSSVTDLLSNKLESLDKKNENLGLWSLFFLCFPVASSTFASAERQFAGMGKAGTIGYLLVDEAGQTVPYFPLGLLQRSRCAMVVGDPNQIEPVVTMAPKMDRDLAMEQLGVDELSPFRDHLISNSSAQILADKASVVQGLVNNEIVGLPLRVHWRCDNPMFGIANQIAYDNMMILGEKKNNFPIESKWLHCRGKTLRRGARYFNPTEIKVAMNLLLQLKHRYKEKTVFIITPFRLMADELRKSAKNNEGLRAVLADGFAENNIGTVHTFQGKEADLVILCLCAGRENQGGVSFVNQKPNILNVAVTRAKKGLYVIGDHDVWAKTRFGKVLSAELHANSEEG